MNTLRKKNISFSGALLNEKTGPLMWLAGIIVAKWSENTLGNSCLQTWISILVCFDLHAPGRHQFCYPLFQRIHLLPAPPIHWYPMCSITVKRSWERWSFCSDHRNIFNDRVPSNVICHRWITKWVPMPIKICYRFLVSKTQPATLSHGRSTDHSFSSSFCDRWHHHLTDRPSDKLTKLINGPNNQHINQHINQWMIQSKVVQIELLFCNWLPILPTYEWITLIVWSNNYILEVNNCIYLMFTSSYCIIICHIIICTDIFTA